MLWAQGWLYESGDAEGTARLAGALRWFWVIEREIGLGKRWAEQALERRAQLTNPVLARILNAVGIFAVRRLELDQAEEVLAEALEAYRRLGDQEGGARQTYHLATAAWFRDDLPRVTRLAEEAVLTEDPWTRGWAHAVLGTIARTTGDFEDADRHLRESHHVFEDFGGPLDLGWSHLRLGALARDIGRYVEAQNHYETGRGLFDEDAIGTAHADAGLGALAWLRGSASSPSRCSREFSGASAGPRRWWTTSSS